MRYERTVLPLSVVAALSAVGVAGYLAWRRRTARDQGAEEPGAFLYSYPLDIEVEDTDDEVAAIFSVEDLLVDEETFPGYRQDS